MSHGYIFFTKMFSYLFPVDRYITCVCVMYVEFMRTSYVHPTHYITEGGSELNSLTFPANNTGFENVSKKFISASMSIDFVDQQTEGAQKQDEHCIWQ